LVILKEPHNFLLELV